MDESTEDVILATFPRGGAELRFTIGTYKGRKRLDVRIYYPHSGAAGPLPTKRGVSFSDPDEIRQLLQRVPHMLQQALQFIDGNTAATEPAGKSRARVPVAEVLALHDEGHGPGEIAARLGCNRSTVHRILRVERRGAGAA